METLEEIKKGNSAIVEIYQTYVIKKPKNTADTEIFIKTQMQAADVVNYVSGILKESAYQFTKNNCARKNCSRENRKSNKRITYAR